MYVDVVTTCLRLNKVMKFFRVTSPEDTMSQLKELFCKQHVSQSLPLMDPPSPYPAALKPSHRDNLMSSQSPGETQSKMSGDVWEHIRSLDETENWSDRNAVISKTDHQTHTTWAREVVEEMVEKIPASANQAPPPTALPAHAPPHDPSHSDEFQYMNEFNDEDFRGSAAQFDVGYLESLGNTNPAHVSALTRESLYVKFDPLVGSQSLLNSARRSPNFPRGAKTPKSVSNDLMAMDTPPREAPGQPVDLLSSSPANLVSFKTPQTSVSHTPGSRREAPHASTVATPSFSPSKATPTSSAAVPESHALVEVLKYGEEDMAAMIQQTREEERVKYEAQVQLLREELARKEQAAQKRVERIQRECQALRNEMKLHVSAKQQLQSELEREREMSKTNETSLEVVQAHYEQLRTQVKETEQQRDSALKDFEGLDKSFTDLHQRYLKLKQSSDTQQQSESALRAHIAQLEVSFREAGERCRQLREDSTEQQNRFNTTVEAMRKEHSQDVAITKATVKKLELQVESLQRALEEKEREKKGLTQLCDELLEQINPPQ